MERDLHDERTTELLHQLEALRKQFAALQEQNAALQSQNAALPRLLQIPPSAHAVVRIMSTKGLSAHWNRGVLGGRLNVERAAALLDAGGRRCLQWIIETASTTTTAEQPRN